MTAKVKIVRGSEMGGVMDWTRALWSAANLS